MRAIIILSILALMFWYVPAITTLMVVIMTLSFAAWRFGYYMVTGL